MGVCETQHKDDGHVVPPDVKLTPAAQPPSPQPSITGAQTAHLLDEIPPRRVPVQRRLAGLHGALLHRGRGPTAGRG